VKIWEEKKDAGLRRIGLSSLADEGLKVLNRAAEDAVKATPYLLTPRNMIFNYARTILIKVQQQRTYKIALRCFIRKNSIL
jgi:hypothetical protein